jgi:glycosyltransferase involved in cell wall biosynthesis
MPPDRARAPDLLHVFATFAVGGPQARFAALANHIGAAARHRIIAMDGRLDAREKLDPSLDVSFPALALPKGNTQALWRAIRAYLRAAPPDLLVTSNWGSIDWAIARLATGVRHLHMEDGFGPEERDAQLARRVWTRRLVLRGSEILLPSRTLLRLATDVWRLPTKHLHYVPNGIDLRRFSAAVPATLPPGEGPIIGTIAALRAEKNISRLLRAFALLRATRPVRLIIAGDGPARAALQAEATALGIGPHTHFAGHTAVPEQFVAAFEVFALSSDTEQMPLSVLEAMAGGLPVASTDVGDVRTMLAAENDEFIVPRDDALLAGALGALLDDPARAHAIGAANRAKAVAEFDQGVMFARHRALLDV